MTHHADGTLLLDAQDLMKDVWAKADPTTTRFVQYEARGCIYDIESYEDGYVVVTMFSGDDEVKWDATTHAADDDRVIDVVRQARHNAKEIAA